MSIVLLMTVIFSSHDEQIKYVDVHTASLDLCTVALQDLAPILRNLDLQAMPFGSLVTNLRTPESDIDVQVLHTSALEKIRHLLGEKFRTEWFVNNHRLRVLTVKHILTGLSIDIKEDTNREADISLDIKSAIREQALVNFLRKLKCWHKQFMPTFEFLDRFSEQKVEKPLINAFATTLLGVMFWQRCPIKSLKSFGDFLHALLEPSAGIRIDVCMENREIIFRTQMRDNFEFFRWNDSSFNMFAAINRNLGKLPALFTRLESIEEDFENIRYPNQVEAVPISHFQCFLSRSRFTFQGWNLPCGVSLWEEGQPFLFNRCHYPHKLQGIDIDVGSWEQSCTIDIENLEEGDWKISIWLDNAGFYLPTGRIQLIFHEGFWILRGGKYWGWKWIQQDIPFCGVRNIYFDVRHVDHGSITVNT